MNRFDMLEKLEKGFGCEWDHYAEDPCIRGCLELINIIVKAMSDDDFKIIYNYICRMYKIKEK